MTAWSPPRPSDQALAALAALAAPSRPQPLPGSRQVAPGAFAIDKSRDEVIAAYSRPDAPVPPESRLEMRDSVPVVVSPFGEAAILFSQLAQGCVYTLLTQPTLVIEGVGKLPSASLYAAVGFEDTDMNTGKPRNMLVAAPTIDGKPWVLLAGQFESEDGEGDAPPSPSEPTEAIFVQSTFREAQAAGDSWNVPRWPAKLERDDDGAGIRVEAKTPHGVLRVRARRTHGICALMTILGEDPAQSIGTQVSCTKKDRSAPVARKIVNIGGKDEKGKKWRLDQAGAVARIEAGERFYVQPDGGDEIVPLTVVKARDGSKYLSAKRQGERTELLLHLPSCR